MTHEKTFSDLRNILAELYFDEMSARRIAFEAGVNEKHISFSKVAINSWHSILREAEETGKIEAVLNVVLSEDEYGANQQLRAASEEYSRLRGITLSLASQRVNKMSNGIPGYKRRALSQLKAALIEDYEAVSNQLNYELDAGNRSRLNRKMQDLASQISEIDKQINPYGAVGASDNEGHRKELDDA